MNRPIFVSCLLAALPLSTLCALCTLCASTALALDESAPATERRNAPPPRNTLLPSVSGNLFYFNRRRLRHDVETDRLRDNLHHQTLQNSLDISSPFYGDTIGFELGMFATQDLINKASPDHEISFFPWNNPWSPDWSKRDARNGASLYRAHLKLRHNIGDQQLWSKIGYFQPAGPGVLGVNWSLMPGTYRGIESGLDSGPLTLALAWANAYKAPWFPDIYHFRKNDGQTRVDNLWSFGARYRFAFGLSAETAYGASQNFLKSAHLKLKYTTPDEKIALSYQLYGMADSDESDKSASPNDQYNGHHAHQHFLTFAWRPAPYALRAEMLHTRAPANQPQHLGYFAYRLIGRYGGANGAYEPWWDNRSDWNHNKETAVFLGLSRSLNDLLGVPGVTFSGTCAYGWGGQAHGIDKQLQESAWTLDLAYTIPAGPLKNTRLSLHYTRYDNKTNLPSWTGFNNLFQDERDVKFLLHVPWSIN